MKGKTEDLDVILGELGNFGPYQVRVFCLILLPIVFNAVYLSQYIFVTGDVKYRCQVPECEFSPAQFVAGHWALWALPETDRCERFIPVGHDCTAHSFLLNETELCSSWIYDNENTIVAEFDLACQEWKRTLVGTIHSAGTLASLPVTAFVSDTYGRRIALILTAVFPSVLGAMRAFSSNYAMYLVLEFLDAMLGNGVYSTGFILALELVGANGRVLCGNIMCAVFALGQAVTAVLAWIFPFWKTYLLVIYTPSLLFISYYWLIEESIRWLMSKGKEKEAVQIIFKVATANKKRLSSNVIKALEEDDQIAQLIPEVTPMVIPETQEQTCILWQILQSKKIMLRLCICSFWWLTVTFVYYGLSINSVSLAGNMYINFILTSLAEIPGYFLSTVTLDRFGRKKPIIISFFLCSLSLISLPFVEVIWLRILLNLIGKLCISMAFSSIYIFTGELFPTEARHSLLGTCSMVGRIGAMVAPQTPLLMTHMESLPHLIFGVMSGASCFLLLLVPETMRTRLPDTLYQAECIGSEEISTL